MDSAKKLLLKYMDLIKDPERATSLIPANAAIEIPYLVDVGLPGKFERHAGILAFLRQINTLFPDVADARVHRQKGAEYRFLLVDGL